MTDVRETARTTVTKEGIKAVIKWLFEGLPSVVALLTAAGSVVTYLYVGVPSWAVVTVLGVATFLTVLFALKLPALYRAVGAYHPAVPGWGYATTVHLWQAACLLEDIEPQASIPRKAQVWVHQLAFALENGELGVLPGEQVKMDSRIQMTALRVFAQKRGLHPKCFKSGVSKAPPRDGLPVRGVPRV